MIEVEQVASKFGVKLPVLIDKRIADAAIGVGERVGVAMPHTRSVYARKKLLDVVYESAQRGTRSLEELNIATRCVVRDVFEEEA